MLCLGLRNVEDSGFSRFDLEGFLVLAEPEDRVEAMGSDAKKGSKHVQTYLAFGFRV